MTITSSLAGRRLAAGRKAAVITVAGALVAILPSMLRPAPALAAVPGDRVDVTVAGSPLSSVVISPPSISPSFSNLIHDYVVRCSLGLNPLSFTLTAQAGGTIQVGGQSGATVTVPVNLGESQAAVVNATDPSNPTGPPVQYWVRCLPHDFPHLGITRSGNPPPGYYLTGNVTPSSNPNSPSSTYAMVLDNNGTPVWYQTAPGGAINVELLPTDVIAWTPSLGPGIGTNPSAGYNLYQLDTQTQTQLLAPIPPTDPHELLPTANGRYMVISSPLLTGVDLTVLGPNFANIHTLVDCIVQEVDSSGVVDWQWKTSEHVSIREAATAPMLASPVQVNGAMVGDIYHCNSVDVDPFNSNNVLISLRNTSAVYLVDKSTGHVKWKLGGTSPTHDPAPVLAIRNDPETTISGQHDARFEPNGDVSVYDDHSQLSAAARGVQYAIDTQADTATLDFSYAAPNSVAALATGGFRRYNGGSDNLITWGFKPETHSGFTEVDGSGARLLDMTFPSGEFNYRTYKVPTSALDINVLRATAGLPRPVTSTVSWQSLGFVATSKPASASWGPGRLDVFVRGTDNQLWHRWNDGTGWFPWEPLGGILASGPAVAAWGPNRLDVFVRGTDNQLWHLWWDGTHWSTWESLGGVLASGPAVASWGPGRLDVVAQGTYAGIWHKWFDGFGWNGFESLGGASSGDPAASSWGLDRLDLFTRQPDGSLGHLWYDSGVWYGWEWFAGSQSAGPAATSTAPGQVDVVAPGADSVPLRFEYTGRWQNWQTLFGGTTQTAALTALSASSEEVTVTGTDNQVYTAVLSTGVSTTGRHVRPRWPASSNLRL